MINRFTISVLLFAGLSVGQAQNQPINDNPVTLKVKPFAHSLPWGSSENLEIEVNVEPGHHAYTDMIKTQWLSPEGIELGQIDIFPIVTFLDKFSKKQREGIEKFATVKVPMKVPQGFPGGKHSGKLAFTYQVCSESYCLFPKTINLDFNFLVSQSGQEISKPDVFSFEAALKRGTFWTYLFVFIAGILTCLTPCIFPMIPITISIIGAKAASHHSKTKGFFLSLSYVLGIATTYSSLGLLAASTGSLFGALLGNFWVVLALFGIFVLMSLSMFGLFELQAPRFIRNKIGTASTGTGFTGAYLGGIFAGIVASPCVGPVLVGILTYVAQTAQLFFGFTLLFTYAMGLGMLFLVIGTSSHLMSRLPRSGPWLEEIKNIFGTSFLAIGFYYLKPVLDPKLFSIFAATTALVLTSYLGAFAPIKINSKLAQIKRGLLLAGFAISIYWLCTTLFPNLRNFSADKAPAKPSMASLGWLQYSDALFDEARGRKTPIIIDFGADWCVACHELDEFTLSSPKVIELGKAFTKFKVDATTSNDFISALQRKYNIVGLPTILFIGNDGAVRNELTVTGFIPADDFYERMQKVLNSQ